MCTLAGEFSNCDHVWCVEGLSGKGSVKLGTDENRYPLSYGPSRQGVQNIDELNLHFLNYTFLCSAGVHTTRYDDVSSWSVRRKKV